ncbi:unnamed protein product, partial [Lampetra planeri]
DPWVAANHRGTTRSPCQPLDCHGGPCIRKQKTRQWRNKDGLWSRVDEHAPKVCGDGFP